MREGEARSLGGKTAQAKLTTEERRRRARKQAKALGKDGRRERALKGAATRRERARRCNVAQGCVFFPDHVGICHVADPTNANRTIAVAKAPTETTGIVSAPPEDTLAVRERRLRDGLCRACPKPRVTDEKTGKLNKQWCKEHRDKQRKTDKESWRARNVGAT